MNCGVCRKTFCPFGSALGLRPRQRVAEELVERLDSGVVDLSYRKTCALGHEWLGGTVSPRTLWREVQARGRRVAFTRRRPLKVLLVDGTRVRAGGCAAKRPWWVCRSRDAKSGAAAFTSRSDSSVSASAWAHGRRSWQPDAKPRWW